MSTYLYFHVLIRVKNSRSLHKTFNVEPLYLQHENSGKYNNFYRSVKQTRKLMFVLILTNTFYQYLYLGMAIDYMVSYILSTFTEHILLCVTELTEKILQILLSEQYNIIRNMHGM